MKKNTLALMALLAFTFSLNAQQFVSTTPSNRNAVLEEFTGRNCQYCPDGHRIANQISEAHPGRFWSVNVHCTGLSPSTYPNLNCTDGHAIAGGINFDGIPTGVVNRHSGTAADRGQWMSLTNTQLNQPAECNVAGRAIVNPATRMASITVEVYYTGNSNSAENYLTVAMLQDSIMGSHVNGSSNPSQMINGQYCNMHVLRDIISDNVWGDVISPTTQGTLITKTYQYQIPATIGSPNGVEVDLNNITFLAWVSEKYQGSVTRPILNVNELERLEGSDDPIYPVVRDVKIGTNCSNSKNMTITIMNGGQDVLTSMTLNVVAGGNTFTGNWSGSLNTFDSESIEIPIELTVGHHTVEVKVVEANGQTVDFGKTMSFNCLDWVTHSMDTDEERFKLVLMQDKHGEQITWEFVDSNGEVLASGGPYATLVGGSATQPHVEYVHIPVNECVRFSIYDSGENGICCNYGNGYFTISDSQNNVIIGNQSNGDFGKEASFQIKTQSAGTGEVIVGETQVTMASETEAHFVSSLQTNMYPEQVGFMYGKLTSSQMNTVVGVFNEFQKILASVDDLEPNKMYRVKAFAVVNGETYYGQENHFFTSYTGLGELENSLRLYPNPTSGVLNIEGEGIASLEVYNAIGQRILMKEVSGNSVQINTEAMDNGAYFIRIHANDGTVLNRTFSVAR